MKKIIFFTARDLLNIGGGERMLSFIANRLSLKYDVTILTPYVSDSYFPLEKSVKKEDFGICYKSSSIERKLGYFKIIKCLRDRIKRNDFDFFITSSSMAFTLTSLVLRKYDKRFYAWMHLSYFHPTPWFLKLYDHISLKKYNVISINSMDVDKYIKHTKHVYLIPNPTTFSSSPISQEVLEKSNKIISVGRLEKGKGFDLLINICSKVFNDIPFWTLHIYGQDDGEGENLQKLIRENKMTDRIFLHKPSDTILKEYLKSSIFATATRIESFSLVLLEACICGLPCIAYDVPSGPRDIVVDGFNGYLIKDLDEEHYIKCLKKMMTSPSCRSEFSRNAIVKSSQFDINLILEKWYNLLDR